VLTNGFFKLPKLVKIIRYVISVILAMADITTCRINVCQSVSDYTGTDGLNWFSAIGPDLSGLPLWSEHA